MSVQTRKDDGCISFEDTSLIYVRDKHGVLRSPPGYDKTDRAVSTFIKECDKVYGASCVMPFGDPTLLTQQSPCNLFQICKNFIAKNLHLVESLNDFPETVGQELFCEALQVQTFHKNADYLKIFCKAYEGLVLKHLCLREATILIDEYLEFFQCFNSLTKLDLSHCRLGNKHEYLNFIGKMKSLECLYLKDNCLTDDGLTTWSLPHRMLNAGPEFLKTLDLSCNPALTDSCLKSLLKFTHLKSLNLSGTSVSLIPGISRVKKLMNFSLVSYIEEFSSEMFVITTGWAASFISELSSKLNEKSIENVLRTRRKARTKNFYQHQRSDSPAESGKSSRICTNTYPVMLLQSVEHVLPGTLRTLEESKPNENRGKKRLVTSDKCGNWKRQKVCCNAHVKDEHLDELSDAMLLDSYLKYL